MLRDFWWRRLHRRCRAPGPTKLPDCANCIRPRGHQKWPDDGAEWHADGNGYIWNESRWHWRGPTISLSDYYPRVAEPWFTE